MAVLPQRRTAYFTINPTLIDDLTPHYAGRDAGEDPWTRLRPAREALRRAGIVPERWRGCQAR
jgi:hypothetical protein